MTLPSLSRSASRVTQVVISGRVEDTLKPGEPPRGQLTVTLVELDPSTNAPQELSLAQSIQPDGNFAFYGSPETAFSQIGDRSYRLRLEVSAPNYQTESLSFNLGPIPGQPERVSRSTPVGVPDLQVVLFTREGPLPVGNPATATHLPLSQILLRLRRYPVRLRGRVISLADPNEGIANATLAITAAASTSTNSEGFFEFPDPMPLQESLQITVSAANFEPKTLDDYELDYTHPINLLRVALKPSP